MKSILYPNKRIKFSQLILPLALLISITACTRKFAFMPSSVVPAAEGKVRIQKDRNKNYQIQVDIYNLAEPDRLQPPARMYLLWMQVDQDKTINLGQIKTSKKTFSKSLKASFKTTSPYKPAKIIVTAEENANVQVPAWKVILTTDRL